ncbi:VanZ family protein [Deinococcus metalli]|uniref:VanZ family protein n=1 Tax=Deinococcus metalli TaxID=1141878 RepID=A0A7W8KJU2_9DEIO|nr:antibiotic resistance protein VanZ [Deinococcus metalli]MBB5377849.1 VanZ family protein [Deinococcus metalli]GHF55492.1 hypothetical protein GCM10017781_34840 [Deinococcus metalli]
MRRNCGRWILAALLLVGADWHVLHTDLPGNFSNRAAHLLLLALLGFALARVVGRRGVALALCAWWSAALQWHLAFVPGHEVGVNVWLPDVLAAIAGAWWAVRRPALAARVNGVRSVAVLSDIPR